MKTTTLLIGMLALLFTKQLKGQEYCVVKIDSTEKLYLITVKNATFTGIVISYIDKCERQKPIIIGGKYKLKVEKYSGLKILNIPDLKIKSGGKPSILIEDVDVCKLTKDCIVYQSSNLCGLYLIE